MYETKMVSVGKLTMGGHNPVWVQSMTNTDTRDTEKTLAQIRALHKAGCDLVRVSVYDEACARAVRTLTQGGLSADKILLGIPAYGRMWRQVSGSSATQTAGISGTKVLNFPDLLALESQGYTRYYDGAAKAAYWVGGGNFVSGEDEQSIRDKAQWAVQQGLQGAAVWSYGQDDSGKLLAWVKEALAQ